MIQYACVNLVFDSIGFHMLPVSLLTEPSDLSLIEKDNNSSASEHNLSQREASTPSCGQKCRSTAKVLLPATKIAKQLLVDCNGQSYSGSLSW